MARTLLTSLRYSTVELFSLITLALRWSNAAVSGSSDNLEGEKQVIEHVYDVHGIFSVLPVNARDVDDDVDHVAAQLVALHVDRRGVRRDVDLGHDVEEEGLLNPCFLKKEKKRSQ